MTYIIGSIRNSVSGIINSRILSVLLVSIVILSSGKNLLGQNLFKDPSFDEPQAPTEVTGENCEHRGIVFDEFSKIYYRLGNGSPDIVTPFKEDCKLYLSSSLITSQCLGMAFSHTVFPSSSIFKEAVFTKLKQPLVKDSVYEISFDILFGRTVETTLLENEEYRASHFNVVLIKSSSRITDTLTIPVSEMANKNWERAKLVFQAKSAYDIVQFDFFSPNFYESEQNETFYVFLDNFSLWGSEENPKVSSYIPLESRSRSFSYYFESDREKLSGNELRRFMSDSNKLDKNNIKKVSILAYTDNTHTVDYNMVLSSHRANFILRVLKKQLKSELIEYSSEGKGIDVYKEKYQARRVDVIVEYE